MTTLKIIFKICCFDMSIINKKRKPHKMIYYFKNLQKVTSNK